MAISSSNSSSTNTKQGFPRKLSEILQEKQEPFKLELYLLERGCKRRSCSTKQQNKNSSSKTSTRFSSIARSVYNKMAVINGVLLPNNARKSKRARAKARARRRDNKEASQTTSRSSASWSEMDTSITDAECVLSPANNATAIHELAADERVMTQWRIVEENKQNSPDSVLVGIDLLHSIPVYKVRKDEESPRTSSIKFQKKVSDESILSASLWEMLVLSRKEKAEIQRSKSVPQYMNSKKAMQQTRQLLFDCVREVVENSNSSNNAKQMKIRTEKGLMGPEEIGRILCSNLKAWGKLSAGETSIKKLLRKDLLSSTEWDVFEPWKQEIGEEISNGIFEEIIDDVARDIAHQN